MRARLTALYHRGVLSLKRLYYRDRGEPIEYGGHKLRYLPGTRPVRLKYIDSEIGTVRNDAKQIRYFLDNVRAGDFVLDIGANVGQYAVLFAALVQPMGRVISFEPDPDARALLNQNLALNGFSSRVRVEDIALSDRSGTSPFYSREVGDSTASLAKSSLGSNLSPDRIHVREVKTEPLDHYLSSRGLPSPDWIKLDTEGAEITILRGARAVLRSGTKIVCELHPYAWAEFRTSYAEFLDIVRGCGRSVRYLDESSNIERGATYGATIIS